VQVTVGDAGMLPFPDGAADLVTCIEVLEHLPTVAPAVAELARITGDRCVVSVPYEPWFRLGNLGRGKNIGRLGNDPEHLHAFNPGRLRRILAASFDDVRVVPAFPWLIAVARGGRRD
jgi:Methyltransferase domain